MARAAAAAAPRTAPRAKPARSENPRSQATRTKTARSQAGPHAKPARRAPARHSPRTRVPSRRAATHRRVSGAAAGAPAVALPVRVLNAPFARAARARTGSLLDALLSGRGWIALVFVLLAGIVFFNVDLLQMNRDIARDADRISALKRENARLVLDEARLASSDRIQESAAQLGLVLPAPGEVRYLTARPIRDAGLAAKRVSAPNLSYVAPEPVAPEPIVPTTTDPTVTDPAATTPPAAEPTVADPSATADPAATAEPAPTTATTPAG